MRGFAKSRLVQTVAVPAQVRDIKDVEALSEDGEPEPFGAEPEIPRHAQVLRMKATRKRKGGGQGDFPDDSRAGSFAGIDLIELVC